jgi:hypothetical protein
MSSYSSTIIAVLGGSLAMVAPMQQAQAITTGWATIDWMDQSRNSFNSGRTSIKLNGINCSGTSDGSFFIRTDSSNKEYQIQFLLTAISWRLRVSLGYNPDCDVYRVSIDR